jgi:hypothetical protein
VLRESKHVRWGEDEGETDVEREEEGRYIAADKAALLTSNRNSHVPDDRISNELNAACSLALLFKPLLCIDR